MNRKIRFLLPLLCLSAALCLGQQKLLVSATVAPSVSHTNYIHRYYYPNSDGQIVEPVYINGIRWATGYSAGVSILYNYVPGWSVSSGIWFQQLTTRQARQTAAGEGTTTLHNRAVRIPLLLNYASSTNRLSPYFSFGLLTDIPLPSRVVVYRTGESTQYLKLETSPVPFSTSWLALAGNTRSTSAVHSWRNLYGHTSSDKSGEPVPTTPPLKSVCLHRSLMRFNV